MTQAPTRTRPAPLTATVVRTERMSATMIRVVLGGSELLERFEPSESTDSYVKLSFLAPGVDYPRPVDLQRVRNEMPPEHWPVVRTYTVRAFDPAAGELTIDFVVHGDNGVAGPWAAAAKAGDQLLLTGPGGAYAPATDADWYLFLGDESALPAIAAALERLPADATGQVLIAAPGTESIFPITAPPGVAVAWIDETGVPVGTELVQAAGQLDFPVGTVDAFVHGEAGFVKELRRLLRVERGVPRERLSISGYWRVGATEEGWRAGKAEWNRQADEVEVAAGLT